MGSKAANSKHLTIHHFSSVLSSAMLEWFLLLLLFLNGVFSYLVTKFAIRSKLQPPCVLCSRLDHVIGRSGPTFYRDLLCDSHKMEISSLAYCCVHRRLSNVHAMCQKCLSSSSTGIHHPLGRNLCTEFSQNNTSEVPLLREDVNSLHVNPLARTCSCCSEPLKQANCQVFRLVRDTIDGDGIELIDVTKNGTNREVTLEKNTDHSAHVKYSELRTSDSDSKLRIDESNGFDDISHKREVDGAENLVQLLDDEEQEECVILEKTTVHSPNVKYSELRTSDSDSELHIDELYGIDISHKREVVVTEDMIPFLDGKEQEEHLVSTGTDTSTHDNTLDELHDIESEVKAEQHLPSEPPCKDSIGLDLDGATEKDKLENNPANQDGDSSIEEPAKDLSSENTKSIPNPIPSPSGSMSLSDAYNLAIRNRTASITSPRYEDVITGKDSSRVYEELKLLISQISAARGVDSPWTDITSSPRIQQPGEESVLYNITKTLSLERSESMVSMEGSIVSEIEGESTVDRLKRQIDLDRKSISLLYKELEEERNASAIAANQAMAMITRIQEEKAAMQMEALQYQRVMEEQVEYDQEALQKCNEIISQKQKYIEELEAELATYRDQTVDAAVAPDWSDISSLGFEEQKAFISDRLQELEERLHHYSNNSSFAESPKLESITEVDENNFSRENGEVSEVVPVKKHLTGDKCLVSLEDEVSWLSERLKALEADNNFLEHGLNSLKNGREGAQFIREIAASLRDLRDLGIALGTRE